MESPYAGLPIPLVNFTPRKAHGHPGRFWPISAIFSIGLCRPSRGQQQWRESAPLSWPDEVRRFFVALEAFDAYLASESPLQAPPEKLFQAPIADALTHIGQIAILRRLAGAPVRGENYYVAKIAAGCVGADQPEPMREFT